MFLLAAYRKEYARKYWSAQWGLCSRYFLLLLLLVLILILFVKTAKLRKRYDNLMKGSDKGSLEEMILKYQERIDQTKTDTGLALEDIKLLNNQITHCLQKVGVVRFKAFEDVGSDLSYSIALLDNKNDGVILTSISRNMSTSYAKPIVKGVSKLQPLR